MEAAWLAYRTEGVRPNATDDEIAECKRAYYAGAQALLMRLVVHTAGSQAPDANRDLLATVDYELGQFNKDVAEGRA